MIEIIVNYFSNRLIVKWRVHAENNTTSEVVLLKDKLRSVTNPKLYKIHMRFSFEIKKKTCL